MSSSFTIFILFPYSLVILMNLVKNWWLKLWWDVACCIAFRFFIATFISIRVTHLFIKLDVGSSFTFHSNSLRLLFNRYSLLNLLFFERLMTSRKEKCNYKGCKHKASTYTAKVLPFSRRRSSGIFGMFTYKNLDYMKTMVRPNSIGPIILF